MKQGDIKRANDRLRHRESRAKSRELQIQSWERELTRAQAAYDAERPAIVKALRELCVEFGDTNWPDDLPLVDVIHTHLTAPLRRERALATARMEQAEDAIRRQLIATERATSGPRLVHAAPAQLAPPIRQASARTRQASYGSRQASHASSGTALPQAIELNGVTVTVQDVPGGAYQATCSCSWHGDNRRDLPLAEGDSQAHARRAHGGGHAATA